jgi:hypothetical protein
MIKKKERTYDEFVDVIIERHKQEGFSYSLRPEEKSILRKMSIYKFLDCSKDLPINFIGEFFSEKLSGFSLKEKEKIIDLFKRDPKYFQKLINRRTNFYSDTLSTSLAVLLSEAMGKPADFKRYFFSGYNSFDLDVLYIFKKFNADISELATDFFETALNRNKFKVAQHVDEYLVNSIDKLELKLESRYLISDISLITPEMRSKIIFHIDKDSINNFLKEIGVTEQIQYTKGYFDKPISDAIYYMDKFSIERKRQFLEELGFKTNCDMLKISDSELKILKEQLFDFIETYMSELLEKRKDIELQIDTIYRNSLPKQTQKAPKLKL